MNDPDRFAALRLRWQILASTLLLAAIVNFIVLTLIDGLVNDWHYPEAGIKDLPPINFIRIKPKPPEPPTVPPEPLEPPKLIEPVKPASGRSEAKPSPKPALAKKTAHDNPPSQPQWTTRQKPRAGATERSEQAPRPRRPALARNPDPNQAPPSVLTPRVEIPTHSAGVRLPNLAGTTSRVDGPPGSWGDRERRTSGGSPGGGSVGKQRGSGSSSGGAEGAGNSGVQVLSRTLPDYPGIARSRKIEGWVLVEITVDRNGLVGNPRVVGANPAGVFEQAALAAIRHWRFKPAHRQGIAVEQRVRQKILFHLNDG